MSPRRVSVLASRSRGRALAGARASVLVACFAAQPLSACGDAAEPARVKASSELTSADAVSVLDNTRDAFSLPMPGLLQRGRSEFFVGNSFFNQNWITAPASVQARDGLGPLFNARSCSTCHFKDGRGRAPEAGGSMESMLLRVSIPGADAAAPALAHPVYGDQIQDQSIAGVPSEAHVLVDYVERAGQFGDGEPYVLQEPRFRLTEPGYRAITEPLLMSGRVAPALVGLGLLEAVSASDVLAHADETDRDGDGISGRANRVWDMASQALGLGRFGWKAEQPSVRQQTAAAFLGDMGITSSLFPRENCTPSQDECARALSGGTPEIDDRTLDSVTRYVRTLAVPAPRAGDEERVRQGEQLFATARCDTCHRATLRTGRLTDLPELSGLAIHPYTDLLLHDLGEGLADHRPAFQADGREWRTAPLWGLGLVSKVNGHTRFLHDGRARSLSEAVLWHGGEGEAAKLAFVRMPRADREALLAFVESR